MADYGDLVAADVAEDADIDWEAAAGAWALEAGQLRMRVWALEAEVALLKELADGG